MAAPLVARLGAITGLGSSVFENPGDWSVGDDKNHLYAQLSALSKEYHGSQPGRDVMLQSFIQPVLAWIGRQTIQHRSKSTPSRPGNELMRRFQRLLDTEFKLQPKLETCSPPRCLCSNIECHMPRMDRRKCLAPPSPTFALGSKAPTHLHHNECCSDQ